MKKSAEDALSKTKDAAKEKLKVALKDQINKMEEARSMSEKKLKEAVSDAQRSADLATKDILKSKENELRLYFQEENQKNLTNLKIESERNLDQAVQSEKIHIIKLETRISEMESNHLKESEKLKEDLKNERTRIEDEVEHVRKEGNVQLNRIIQLEREKVCSLLNYGQ